MTEMSDPVKTAFVLAKNADCGQIARALRASGYRAVDPVELDWLAGKDERSTEDAAVIVRHDLEAMLACDMIVTGPECELLPWAVALVATACTAGMPVEMIEKIVPAWRKA